MRGNPGDTAQDMLIHREVAEYLMTKEGGLNRRDIHGERRRGTHVERRNDLAAVTRRVCGHVGRSGVRRYAGTFGFIIGVTTLLAGLELVAMYIGVLTIVAVAVVVDRIPDVVFDGDVAPAATVTRSHTPGMSDAEYARRKAIHGERNDLREEKIEEKRKERERERRAKQNTF